MGAVSALAARARFSQHTTRHVPFGESGLYKDHRRITDNLETSLCYPENLHACHPSSHSIERLLRKIREIAMSADGNFAFITGLLYVLHDAISIDLHFGVGGASGIGRALTVMLVEEG